MIYSGFSCVHDLLTNQKKKKKNEHFQLRT